MFTFYSKWITSKKSFEKVVVRSAFIRCHIFPEVNPKYTFELKRSILHTFTFFATENFFFPGRGSEELNRMWDNTTWRGCVQKP